MLGRLHYLIPHVKLLLWIIFRQAFHRKILISADIFRHGYVGEGVAYIQRQPHDAEGDPTQLQAAPVIRRQKRRPCSQHQGCAEDNADYESRLHMRNIWEKCAKSLFYTCQILTQPLKQEAPTVSHMRVMEQTNEVHFIVQWAFSNIFMFCKLYLLTLA